MKSKIKIFLILGALFAIFNYTAFLYHDKAETVFFIVRVIFYFLMAGVAIFVKLRFHFEIERPRKEIHYLWLAPFLLTFVSSIVYGFVTKSELNPIGFQHDFFLEMGIEVFGVIVEDLIFVDFALDILLELLPKRKHSALLACVIAAFIFVLVRCSYFTLYSWDVSLFLLFFVFCINFICGYLAVYFDSVLIPLSFHFLCNTLNLVIASEIYLINYDLYYYFFMSFVLIASVVYSLALYRISRLMEYRDIYLQEHKELLNEEKTTSI